MPIGCVGNARSEDAMTTLSVNLNKIAVLRNARGGDEPNLRKAAETCIEAGCGGITVHPRPDRRHVTAEDVALLAELTRGRVEFNLEGNPFAPPRQGYPGFVELVRHARPTQATLVPDSDGQITSDHGFDLIRDVDRLAPLVADLNALGSGFHCSWTPARGMVCSVRAQSVLRAWSFTPDRMRMPLSMAMPLPSWRTARSRHDMRPRQGWR